MKTRICLLALALFLTSCTPDVQQAEENSDNEQLSVADSTVTPTPEPEPAPTDIEIPEGADSSQANLAGGIWALTGEFQWEDPRTQTNVLYTYEGFFILDEIRRMQTMETLYGHAAGDGGVNVNGECLETVPVEATWTFVIQGKVIDLDGGDTLEFSLDDPVIKSVDVPPFVNCMPDVDEDFRNNLLTFWVTSIPSLPPEFRQIPAKAGVHCPGVFDFDEEGLGSLKICYTVVEP